MKSGSVLLAASLVILTGVAMGVGAEEGQPSDAERAAESRKLTQSFAEQLRGELVRAIKAGGPESAIPVCHSAAPAITEEMAAEKGWSVGRTALKLRNPANAPDPWERSVLLKFQDQIKQGADVKELEVYETATQDGKPVFRYMKAIPTQKPCLTCHGQNVSEPLRKTISELYPQDQAVGFSLGELRGAFTIVQPLP
jgi:hypothetical protein